MWSLHPSSRPSPPATPTAPPPCRCCTPRWERLCCAWWSAAPTRRPWPSWRTASARRSQSFSTMWVLFLFGWFEVRCLTHRSLRQIQIFSVTKLINIHLTCCSCCSIIWLNLSLLNISLLRKKRLSSLHLNQFSLKGALNKGHIYIYFFLPVRKQRSCSVLSLQIVLGSYWSWEEPVDCRAMFALKTIPHQSNTDQ